MYSSVDLAFDLFVRDELQLIHFSAAEGSVEVRLHYRSQRHKALAAQKEPDFCRGW